jgi:hypothetical protein
MRLNCKTRTRVKCSYTSFTFKYPSATANEYITINSVFPQPPPSPLPPQTYAVYRICNCTCERWTEGKIMSQRSVQQRCSPIYNWGMALYSHVENNALPVSFHWGRVYINSLTAQLLLMCTYQDTRVSGHMYMCLGVSNWPTLVRIRLYDLILALFWGYGIFCFSFYRYNVYLTY